MWDSKFKQALPILEKIESAGYQAFFVGGSVRNCILAISITDVDIATSASPAVIQELFPKVIPVGIEHGTVIVRQDRQSFEVTTFRSEGSYSDKRHPDQVTFITDIDMDLSRRDFTMNALAMDRHGDIRDPFDGQTDIHNKKIRTVGNPTDRFMEDPLRMMRAFRFVSQLGFTIEADTLMAVKSSIDWIDSLAVERLAKELEKLFAGGYYMEAIGLCSEVNLWGYLPVFNEIADVSAILGNISAPFNRLYEVFTYIKLTHPAISIKDMIKKWKQSNQTYHATSQLVEAMDVYKKAGLTNWLVYQLPSERYDSFIRLVKVLLAEQISIHQLNQVETSLPIKNRQMIDFSGNDLIHIYPNRSKGPWLQTYLNEIEYAIVANELANNYTEIKEWVMKWHPPEIE
ncbi:CCA-adding enzyme [Paraliobacillus sp. PM-2]|uniref:CCA tRNA nucleotidyltransferase n=1 Tax=Paraliobacillus sp. PM-2 TaxID=1462524 RepID=UPI00061BCA7A|nr:CCA tRNA nucleotidyltransferase [Paraliobacillus sp. PM-2]CQR46673.1 CCA-adding enzyme [Paraliobacillus sp. PM-2]